MIPPKFRPYCESRGIEILPDDIRFIEKCLPKIHQDDRRNVLKRYCDIWAFEIKEAQNANLGRLQANTYLRNTVEE